MKKNIDAHVELSTPLFLVGFAAVGKTTIGKLLAERLGKHFIDTDEYIQMKYHNGIGTMMQECGIEKFRKREKVILLELAQRKDSLISTGGGMATWDDNMETMLQRGIVLYLSATPEELIERLYLVRASRPLVQGMTREEVEAYVRHTLPKRLPYYEQAHLTVPVPRLTTERDAHAVVKEAMLLLAQNYPAYATTQRGTLSD